MLVNVSRFLAHDGCSHKLDAMPPVFEFHSSTNVGYLAALQIDLPCVFRERIKVLGIAFSPKSLSKRDASVYWLASRLALIHTFQGL